MSSTIEINADIKVELRDVIDAADEHEVLDMLPMRDVRRFVAENCDTDDVLEDMCESDVLEWATDTICDKDADEIADLLSRLANSHSGKEALDKYVSDNAPTPEVPKPEAPKVFALIAEGIGSLATKIKREDTEKTVAVYTQTPGGLFNVRVNRKGTAVSYVCTSHNDVFELVRALETLDDALSIAGLA